jgi:hypothetical protein
VQKQKNAYLSVVGWFYDAHGLSRSKRIVSGVDVQVQRGVTIVGSAGGDGKDSLIVVPRSLWLW